MPLFRRPDGELVTEVAPVRRMMPLVMRGRNESLIYHSTNWDIAKARQWIRDYNRGRAAGERATLFHLLVYSTAKMFHQRPGLNRFVAGGKIYQRKGVWISFAAKTKLADDAPLATVKLEFPQGEKFEDFIQRIVGAVKESRN